MKPVTARTVQAGRQLMSFWVERPATRLVNHCYHHCKLMSSASSNRRDETRARIQEDLMKKRQEFIEAEKERQSKVDFSRYVASHSSLQLHLTEILFTSKPIALTTSKVTSSINLSLTMLAWISEYQFGKWGYMFSQAFSQRGRATSAAQGSRRSPKVHIRGPLPWPQGSDDLPPHFERDLLWTGLQALRLPTRSCFWESESWEDFQFILLARYWRSEVSA